MPIYKKTVAVAEAAMDDIVVNETYDDNSFGRILYEIEMNDMAFFEALIQHDMNELHCLKEGTLLEAEVALANVEAKKSLIKRMGDFVKKCGEKIISAIMAAIEKIKNIIDDKTIVSKFKKNCGSFKGKVTVKTCDYLNYDLKNADPLSQLGAGLNANAGNISGIFTSICGDEYAADSVAEFKKIVSEKNMKSSTFVDGEVSKLLELYKTDKGIIAELNKMLNEYKRAFKYLDGKFVQKAGELGSKAFGKKFGEEDGEAFKQGFNEQLDSSKLLMTAYTAIAQAQIALCKECVGSVKGAMKKIANGDVEPEELPAGE